ncbi:hypothetical protein EHS25_000709 [Saitozyma podzolica]|uniref:Uncharacterized protein n=1 Tax=Saitozyma podzolica TaxID=1890683 RepID=A0A427YWY3_9TREE|nr:hypothetical protein EHS25_000709 [Saitozyma podzolica]
MPIETSLLQTLQSAWSRSKHSGTHTFVADVPELTLGEPSYMSVRLHVIRLPDNRTLEDLPPDEIPLWSDSPRAPINSRIRQNVLRGRLDPVLHGLLPYRPSEQQSSLQTHRQKMERFTSYLQRRMDAGLDVEGTLLDVLDQTDFEPLTDHSTYCKANDTTFDNTDNPLWSFTMHVTGTGECSAMLSIDLDPDREDLYKLFDNLQLGAARTEVVDKLQPEDDRPAKRQRSSNPSGSAT